MVVKGGSRVAAVRPPPPLSRREAPRDLPKNKLRRHLGNWQSLRLISAKIFETYVYEKTK